MWDCGRRGKQVFDADVAGRTKRDFILLFPCNLGAILGDLRLGSSLDTLVNSAIQSKQTYCSGWCDGSKGTRSICSPALQREAQHGLFHKKQGVEGRGRGVVMDS